MRTLLIAIGTFGVASAVALFGGLCSGAVFGWSFGGLVFLVMIFGLTPMILVLTLKSFATSSRSPCRTCAPPNGDGDGLLLVHYNGRDPGEVRDPVLCPRCAGSGKEPQ